MKHHVKNKALIVGSSGMLGRSFIKQYLQENYQVVSCYNMHRISYANEDVIPLKLDVCSNLDIECALKLYNPKIIIYSAGLTDVDGCERMPDLAYQINGKSVVKFASYSRKNNIKFVYISTDQLFPGTKSYYTEEDIPSPLNVYGKSKLQGEVFSLMENEDSLIVRTNFFGKGTDWKKSFTDWLWLALKQGKQLSVFKDVFFSPIAIPKLVEIMAILIRNKACGIFNVCSSERLSKYDFGIKFCEYFNLPQKFIQSACLENAKLTATRPLDMSLSTDKLKETLNIELPTIKENFDSIVEEYRVGELND